MCLVQAEADLTMRTCEGDKLEKGVAPLIG